MSLYLPAVRWAAEGSRSGHRSPAAPSEPKAHRGLHSSSQDTEQIPDQHSYCLTGSIPHPNSHSTPALQPTSSTSPLVYTAQDFTPTPVRCPHAVLWVSRLPKTIRLQLWNAGACACAAQISCFLCVQEKRRTSPAPQTFFTFLFLSKHSSVSPALYNLCTFCDRKKKKKQNFSSRNTSQERL